MSDDTSVLKTIGRYHAVDELGRGAMGIVYRAFDPVIGRTVALKTIAFGQEDDEAVALRGRLRREASAAGSLTHPNIVTIYDIIEDAGTTAIAMEFVEGQTLADQLSRQGALPIERALDLFEQICSALDYAGSKGIVHRDIKPANIMLTPDGRTKVMDFGIARLGVSTMTQAGTILGSPSYMSPEQIRGLPLDPRSDLFSAAVVFYEMITRERPFSGNDVATTMYRITHEAPTPPSTFNPAIGPGVAAVLERALAKTPAERFATGADLVAELKRASQLSSLGAPAAPGLAPVPAMSTTGTVLPPVPLMTGAMPVAEATQVAHMPPGGPISGAMETQVAHMPAGGPLSGAMETQVAPVPFAAPLPYPAPLTSTGKAPAQKRSPVMLAAMGAGGLVLLLVIVYGVFGRSSSPAKDSDAPAATVANAGAPGVTVGDNTAPPVDSSAPAVPNSAPAVPGAESTPAVPAAGAAAAPSGLGGAVSTMPAAPKGVPGAPAATAASAPPPEPPAPAAAARPSAADRAGSKPRQERFVETHAAAPEPAAARPVEAPTRTVTPPPAAGEAVLRFGFDGQPYPVTLFAGESRVGHVDGPDGTIGVDAGAHQLRAVSEAIFLNADLGSVTVRPGERRTVQLPGTSSAVLGVRGEDYTGVRILIDGRPVPGPYPAQVARIAAGAHRVTYRWVGGAASGKEITDSVNILAGGHFLIRAVLDNAQIVVQQLR